MGEGAAMIAAAAISAGAQTANTRKQTKANEKIEEKRQVEAARIRDQEQSRQKLVRAKGQKDINDGLGARGIRPSTSQALSDAVLTDGGDL